MNLVEGLQYEIKRAKEELIPEYEKLGQGGLFVLAWLPYLVSEAEKALSVGDAVEMLKYYQELTMVE